jgi:hypothetical protein
MNTEPDSEAERSRLLEEFIGRFAVQRPSSTGRLDATAVEVLSALQRAGVDALLLKGPALERTLYRPHEARAYVDVDILVAPDARAIARRCLAELQFIDASEPLGIDDIGGVVHAETWLGGPRSSSPELVVELHLWLAGAQADPQRVWDAVWEGAASIDLAGARVSVPGRPALALGLATHVAQHGPSYIKGLAELRLGLQRWPDEVWDQASALALRIGATDALAAGLRLIDEGVVAAERLGLPASEEAERAIRQIGLRPRGTFHFDAFSRASGLRDRAAVARRALLPKRAWIVDHYRWADRGGLRLAAGYGLHILRAPVWAARAWLFSRRRGRL